MAGEITAGESVALGQEGTGNAVIFNQPDFGAANYRLASLRLAEGAKKQQKENEALEGLNALLEAPEDYFMPDQKEVLDLYDEQVRFTADALRRKSDVRDPRNYEDFTKFQKYNSDLRKKIASSQNAKQTFAAAQKAFDPTKHDTEHYKARMEQFLGAKSVDERAKVPTDFLIEKFDPMEMFSILPGKRIPEDASQAKKGLAQIMTTPEGMKMYVRGTQGTNPTWNTPQEMEEWWMNTWDAIRDKPKPASSGGGTGTGTGKTDKNPMGYSYTLDFAKGGTTSDTGAAFDVIDIQDAPVFYINKWNEPGSKTATTKSTQFMPRTIERDPKTGKIWFWGKMVTESKAGEVLDEGNYKDISVPLEGNETLFKQGLKGTSLENFQQVLDKERSKAVGGLEKQLMDSYKENSELLITTPMTDPVMVDLQENTVKSVDGVMDATVKGNKVTVYADGGRAITLDMEADGDVLKDIVSGRKTVNALFLNPKYGNVAVLRNQDGTKITEAQ